MSKANGVLYKLFFFFSVLFSILFWLEEDLEKSIKELLNRITYPNFYYWHGFVKEIMYRLSPKMTKNPNKSYHLLFQNA